MTIFNFRSISGEEAADAGRRSGLGLFGSAQADRSPFVGSEVQKMQIAMTKMGLNANNVHCFYGSEPIYGQENEPVAPQANIRSLGG